MATNDNLTRVQRIDQEDQRMELEMEKERSDIRFMIRAMTQSPDRALEMVYAISTLGCYLKDDEELLEQTVDNIIEYLVDLSDAENKTRQS